MDFISVTPDDPHAEWFKVAEHGVPKNGSRLHVSIMGRFVTIFRHKQTLSAIDSVCYHAGGPLTMGPIQDIEELGMAVVLCPWHNYPVSIDKGIKVFKAVDMSSGRPVVAGWKVGKTVQRPHTVREDANGVFLSLDATPVSLPSDKDSCSALCGKQFPIHTTIVDEKGAKSGGEEEEQQQQLLQEGEEVAARTVRAAVDEEVVINESATAYSRSTETASKCSQN